MDHYICKGGCDGVSQEPGVCQEPSCPHYGKPLEACGCMDNKHEGAFDKKENDIPGEGARKEKHS